MMNTNHLYKKLLVNPIPLSWYYFPILTKVKILNPPLYKRQRDRPKNARNNYFLRSYLRKKLHHQIFKLVH